MNLLFPAYCVHCDSRLERVREQLCSGCTPGLSLLDIEGRCTKCFEEIPQISGICAGCRERSHAIRASAACFERVGSAASLLREFSQRGRFTLAKDLASFMVVQLEKLGWPWPDLLIPVPMAWEERFLKGFDPSDQLARALGKWIDRPVIHALKKRDTIFLNKKRDLSGSTLLLVGDRNKLFEECAEALQWGTPAVVYGISFIA